ncbi:Hypothetical predicted protein [Lynx pardinus]|uniref:Olfactomedin-like domain-containing protein n=1 Tax=Lynx pardinus TaxID=191816 RepID=A0A485MKY4_LYNPA|nr:Hypothetical predicted protein [Lynx pardinus]
MCQANVTSNRVQASLLPTATLNNYLAFSSSFYEDYLSVNEDIAINDTGLWAIYETEESRGNIILVKINKTTFQPSLFWENRLFCPTASNAFMACGVLYVTKMVSTKLKKYSTCMTPKPKRNPPAQQPKCPKILHIQ